MPLNGISCSAPAFPRTAHTEQAADKNTYIDGCACKRITISWLYKERSYPWWKVFPALFCWTWKNDIWSVARRHSLPRWETPIAAAAWRATPVLSSTPGCTCKRTLVIVMYRFGSVLVCVVCLQVCMCARTYIRMYVCMYVCMKVCKYVGQYVWVCTYVGTYAVVCMYVCMYGCTYVRT